VKLVAVSNYFKLMTWMALDVFCPRYLSVSGSEVIQIELQNMAGKLPGDHSRVDPKKATREFLYCFISTVRPVLLKHYKNSLPYLIPCMAWWFMMPGHASLGAEHLGQERCFRRDSGNGVVWTFSLALPFSFYLCCSVDSFILFFFRKKQSKVGRDL